MSFFVRTNRARGLASTPSPSAGNFAKFLNGGKPFIDDLEIQVQNGGVAVKSASRIGDSDLGVNAKRLNYIASKLREKGWTAPGVGK